MMDTVVDGMRIKVLENVTHSWSGVLKLPTGEGLVWVLLGGRTAANPMPVISFRTKSNQFVLVFALAFANSLTKSTK
jgi:hypothetical protein